MDITCLFLHLAIYLCLCERATKTVSQVKSVASGTPVD